MIEWRTLDWLPGIEISERGDIRRVDGTPLRSSKQTQGYQQVQIRQNGHIRHVLIHRLVCEAWYGPPFEGAQCAHGDGSRTNNHYTNLRWATVKENQGDRARHGTNMIGERNPRAKLTWPEVRAIRAAHAAKQGGKRALAERFGVSSFTVHCIVRNRTWLPENDPEGALAA